MNSKSHTDMQTARASREPDRVSSPCVSICCLNANDLCMGCYRTADEICDWSGLSAIGKREVLQKVAERERTSGRLL